MKKGLSDLDIMRMLYSYGQMNSENKYDQYGVLIKNKDRDLIWASNLAVDFFKNYLSIDKVLSYSFLHAETNAIEKIKDKFLLENSVMYSPIEPCFYCSEKIIDAKIKKLIMHKNLADFLHSGKFSNAELLASQKIGKENLLSSGIELEYIEGKLFPDNFFVNIKSHKFSP